MAWMTSFEAAISAFATASLIITLQSLVETLAIAPYVNPSRLPDYGRRCRKEAMAFAHDRAVFNAVMVITELPAR